MQQAHLDINGVRTKVLTWGKRLEDAPETQSPEDIIILIPGNPGITRFYTVFLQTLHEQTGFTVWAVGHAGHEPPVKPVGDGVPALKGNEALYSLKGQIEHKVAFIEKYVPKNARLHFVGHSVGAYTIVQLLKIREISERVVGNYLLFPTVEYIGDTPNGRFLTGCVYYFLWLIYFLSWIFTLLPSVMQTFLVYVYVKLMGIQTMHVKTIVHFINPSVLQKVFFMAYEEMELIKARDNEIIKANAAKMKLYYSTVDNWVPLDLYRNLKKDIPEIDAEVCVRGFPHTFIFNHSRDVGTMTANWIKEKKR